MPDVKWLESIDACRPASGDLSLSELRDLAAELATNPRLAQVYARIQTVDAAIAEAAVDVPVPEGLQARLMASLAAAVSSSAAAGAAPPVEVQTGESAVVPCHPVSIGPQKVPHEGRWPGGWLAASGALALAASVVLMVYLSQPTPREISADEVMQIAREFHDETYVAGSPTASPVSGNGHKQFPLSAALTPGRGIKWRNVSDFLGRTGVAYDMTRLGVRATLYVVDFAPPRNAPHLEPSLPSAPLGTPLDTGERTIAAWQENGLLYVLVVDGGLPEYRTFVAPSGRVASRETSRPSWLAGNRAPIGSGPLFGKVSLI